MRYHTRQRIRKGCYLALQRCLYRFTPNALSRQLFLRTAIDWSNLHQNSPSARTLVEFSRCRKFERVHYWISHADIQWYASEQSFDPRAISAANKICEHRFAIPGLGEVAFGQNIDWHVDPVTGSRYPNGLFSVRPDPQVDGRFRTELNLHRHLAVLARAWLVTRNRKYGKELITQLLDWLQKTPPVNDTFLNDGLELTARVVLWTHCLFLLEEFFIEENQYLAILQRIETYGTLIEKNYNAARVGNNHQVAEAFGLFFLGLLYPEFKSAKRWLNKGLHFLYTNLEEQFLPGGVHAEQSTTYHLFVLQCYQLALLLCCNNELKVESKLQRRVEEATEYILHLQKPNHKLPLLGNTGFKLFCPEGSGHFEAETFLAIGAVLFQNHQLMVGVAALTEETFWFVGKKGLCLLDGCRADMYPATIKVLPEAGHVMVRSGWDSSAQYVHFDFGPQGLGQEAGHGHDDALSVEFTALREDFLVDPGTYTYVRSNPLRHHLASARAHNTVLVDGRGAAIAGIGSFGWLKTVDAELTEQGACGKVSWFTASHQGYSSDRESIIVERSLLIVQDEYMVIVDRVVGRGKHSVETLFQFHPEIKVIFTNQFAEAWGSKARLRMSFVSSAPTQVSLHRGEDRIQPAWYAEIYGQAQPTLALRAFATATLPFWRITGLFPGHLSSEIIAQCDKSQAVHSGGEGEATAVVRINRHISGRSDTLVVNWTRSEVLVDSAVTKAKMTFLRELHGETNAYVFAGELESTDNKVQCVKKLHPI